MAVSRQETLTWKIMELLWVFFCLVSGVLSDLQLEESGPGNVKPSETLNLLCHVTGGSVTSRSYWHWIRQTPEKGLLWLGCWSGSSYYNPVFQNRLSITADTSENQVSLQLKSVTPEDSAVYYCARNIPSYGFPAWFDVWGKGSVVTVSSATSTAPSVFPLVSCCDPISEGLNVIGCLVTGYFPEPVTVNWNPENLDTTVTTFPAVSDSSSGLYATTSLLKSFSDLNSQEFTCRVDHSPTRTKIETHVSLKECGPVTIIPPTVKLFHSSCDPRGDAHSTIQLLCLVSGFSPASVRVTWLVNGQEDESLFPYTTKPKREGGLMFSLQSELNITQGQWASSKTYTCRVAHKGSFYEDSAQKCTDTDPRGISAYLSPPSAFDLYVSKSPMLTCLIVDLASEKDVKVSWFRESGGPTNPSSTVIKSQFNGTFTITSTLPVQTDDWTEGDTYTCRLEHPDLPFPLSRTISKAPGKRIAPEVYLLPPSPEEKGNTVSLTCLVRNFFPSDITVQWLSDNKEDHAGHHTTTRALKDHGPDPSYFLYSRMIVNRSYWEKGHILTCRVVHEALPSPSRTLEKSLHYSAGN